ncbi:MAG: hypothetical protein L3J42_06415 [Hydrogenimonas sp.]|nr:hypothetical protein [Hydrogenimonas sp.]
MIIHDFGTIEYLEAMDEMRKVHARAVKDGENHLILCSHPKIFTVGYDDDNIWPVPVVKSDRGGSITCHAPGQVVAYFCFKAPKPAQFFKKVVNTYKRFFLDLLPSVRYDLENPGFYLENKKLASLGFRYRNGVSLHGVSLNVDVDLEFCNLVSPCGLRGIKATSLKAEGVEISINEAKKMIVSSIDSTFSHSI